jgi:hypothetical protein
MCDKRGAAMAVAVLAAAVQASNGCARPPGGCKHPGLDRAQETEEWLVALLQLVSLLDKAVLRGEVVRIAMARGDVNESVHSRVTCTRMLGALSTGLVSPALAPGWLARLPPLNTNDAESERGHDCMHIV